jgi:hypothetical protein
MITSGQVGPGVGSYNRPVDQTKLVSFFHACPRYGLPTRMALTSNYVVGVLTAAVPWLIIAVIVFVGVVGASICCGGLRRRKAAARAAAVVAEHESESAVATDTSFASSTSSSAKAPASHILAGAILFNVAFWLVGFGLVANASFRESLFSVFDAIRFAKDGVVGPAVAIADFTASLIKNELPKNPSATVVLNGRSAEDLLAKIGVFSKSVNDSLASFNDAIRYVRIAAVSVFSIAIVLFMLLLLALFALFSMQSSTRSGKSFCSTVLTILPVTLAWVAVACVSVFAVLTADSCMMLSDFHRLILVQSGRAVAATASGIDPATNILFSNKIQCPRDRIGAPVLDELSPFLSSKTAFETLVTTLVKGKPTTGVAQYVSDVFKDLQSCNSIVIFAGSLNHSVCMSRGPILAIFAMWLVLILLATLLTGALFAAKYSSLDMTRFYSPRGFRKQRDVQTKASTLNDDFA